MRRIIKHQARFIPGSFLCGGLKPKKSRRYTEKIRCILRNRHITEELTQNSRRGDPSKMLT